MAVYIIVGETYGMTCVYWTVEDEAQAYKRHLEEINPDEHWRIVTFFPPHEKKDLTITN